jgi:hypothetical protein
MLSTTRSRPLIDTELERGLVAEERGRLQPELAELPGLIKANEKAIGKVRAES